MAAEVAASAAAAPVPAAPTALTHMALRAPADIAAMSRKTSSPVWKYVIQVPGTKDFARLPIPRRAGHPCGAQITVYKSHGSFSTTVPLKHFAKMHPESSIARSVAAREEDSSSQKSLAMDVAAHSATAPSPLASFLP